MDIPAPIPAQPTRFLDRLRSFIRLRGLAYKTEQTYVFWIKRFMSGVNYLVRSATTMMAGWVVLLFTLSSLLKLLLSSVAFPL